ncbi:MULTISPECIES: YeeE/YedE family protein [Halobacteriovorax]|uniref:YeeE/YedE family protein n=1 Tax=Halobacteriovorax vibrionivorans TaxID=2152716 RepID=A0ABY0IFA4_9BACT|nr:MULTISPECIES: YeeE/YedE family protein [Halobacteriovorax]RZF20491.1 YeeE/YedE family protein [Halobacteriovorax vibrionivorans]TGD45721.1 YeeE/YedE family protein [Halobacteriovorax sp. Y22]
MDTFLWPLVGGILIGLSAAMLLLFNGRVAGISGILFNCHKAFVGEGWRAFFIVGLIVGGVLIKFISPEFFSFDINLSFPRAIIAGLLVGVGTKLGSGCTSGHGVCGLARLSKRSFIATITFMLTGAITVFIMGQLGATI